jgi:regulatory protein YycI of two-component signal transduction system YycFG
METFFIISFLVLILWDAWDFFTPKRKAERIYQRASEDVDNKFK